MRGEDRDLPCTSCQCLETPPRAWGRLASGTSPSDRCRNTPTCVGKTRKTKMAIARCWKHPHVRGEDKSASWLISCAIETPPRAWGRLARNMEWDHLARNTPTCVGKTAQADAQWDVAEKHPHVRGEDPFVEMHAFYTRETPPRAWGRPKSTIGFGRSVGNTPTCVGKTPFELKK